MWLELLNFSARVQTLRGAALAVLIILLILRRILLVGIHIPFLLLSALSSLTTLSRLSTLLTLAVLALLTALLSLTLLTAVLFVRIVCHLYSSIFLQHASRRAARFLLASTSLVAMDQ